RGPPSRSATALGLLRGLGFPVVRRVEPGALVARGERLKHALDLLAGRRAAAQAVLGDPLLDLKGRAVLAAVDVHGHSQARFFYARLARALGPLLFLGASPAQTGHGRRGPCHLRVTSSAKRR